MRVLTRPEAPATAPAGGFATRRDWSGGHELVGFRLAQDDALVFALVDQRQWAGEVVTHSVVPVTALAYERHVGLLCTSRDCPRGTVLASVTPAMVGERS